MNARHVFFLMALLFFSLSAYAGFSQPAPVAINYIAGGGSAMGDMISARNSDNEFAFIGCGQRIYDDGVGGVFHIGFCQAQLVDGAPVTCFTENPGLLDGIDSIADSSYITFSWTDDGAGGLDCTRIGSSTQSFYLEKGQKSK